MNRKCGRNSGAAGPRLIHTLAAPEHDMTANANSPFLSERLIARLSPLRRSNFERRLRERVADAYHAVELHDGSALADERLQRSTALLGRLAALT